MESKRIEVMRKQPLRMALAAFASAMLLAGAAGAVDEHHPPAGAAQAQQAPTAPPAPAAQPGQQPPAGGAMMGGMGMMGGQGMMGGMMPMMMGMMQGGMGMGPGGMMMGPGGPGMGMGPGGMMMGPGDPGMGGWAGGVDRVEGRIAFLRAEIKITEAQAPAWNAFADTLRGTARKLAELRAKAPQPGAAPPALPQRLELHEQWLSARLDGLRATRTALAALYEVLTDEQKKTAEELVPMHGGLMGMM
jgi:hypothetical protein